MNVRIIWYDDFGNVCNHVVLPPPFFFLIVLSKRLKINKKNIDVKPSSKRELKKEEKKRLVTHLLYFLVSATTQMNFIKYVIVWASLSRENSESVKKWEEKNKGRVLGVILSYFLLFLKFHSGHWLVFAIHFQVQIHTSSQSTYTSATPQNNKIH